LVFNSLWYFVVKNTRLPYETGILIASFCKDLVRLVGHRSLGAIYTIW
jgi:hypothetical protein